MHKSQADQQALDAVTQHTGKSKTTLFVYDRTHLLAQPGACGSYQWRVQMPVARARTYPPDPFLPPRSALACGSARRPGLGQQAGLELSRRTAPDPSGQARTGHMCRMCNCTGPPKKMGPQISFYYSHLYMKKLANSLRNTTH